MIQTFICMACGKRASVACIHCNLAPDGANGFLRQCYCSVDCQSIDWPKHRPICQILQERKRLYKAGDTARRIFEVFSRRCWTAPVDRIDKYADQLLIHQAEPVGMSRLQPFRSENFGGKQEEAAMLAYSRDVDALMYLHPFLEVLLSGLYISIEEFAFSVKNAKFHMRWFQGNGMSVVREYRHLVLRVTGISGGQYALDMTGAQFGWWETVLPWDFYLATRIRNPSFDTFGTTKARMEANRGLLNENAQHYYLLREQFATQLMCNIDIWQRCNCSLPDLLHLYGTAFDEKQTSLIEQ
ncbi:MAG: hypothetical protein Q9170_008068, partial [Blastenia crenularia]